MNSKTAVKDQISTQLSNQIWSKASVKNQVWYQVNRQLWRPIDIQLRIQSRLPIKRSLS